MLHLVLALLSAAPSTSETDAQVAQVRAWLSGPRGPEHVEDLEAPFPAAKELVEGSAGYREVIALVSRGCALSNEAPPVVPRGHLWEADLDGDGAAERFFTGGCSPAPYHVVLKHGAAGWTLWREGPGFLLETQRRDELTILVSAHDGYGVERGSALRLEALDAAGATKWQREFQVVGAQPAAAAPAAGERCVLRRTAALRSGPRVDDTPEDSGLGFDYPGNLMQMLAKGSSGLSLGRKGAFRLCAFAAVPAREDLVKGLRTPALSTLSPTTPDLVLGWVPEAALGAGR